MGINKVNDELISTVRAVVGVDYSEMDIIRALHMAKNDPTAAINIIFDAPSFKKSEIPKTPPNPNRNVSSDSKKLHPKSRTRSFSEGGDCNLRVSEGKDGNLKVSEGVKGKLRVSEGKVGNLKVSEGGNGKLRVFGGEDCNLKLRVSEGEDGNLCVSEGKDGNLRDSSNDKFTVSVGGDGNLNVSEEGECNLRGSLEGGDGNLRGSSEGECVRNEVEMENGGEGRRDCGGESSSRGNEWWFVGSTDVLGMSTCKGRILKVGEEVNFNFPEKKNLLVAAKFGGGRGRQVANPDIVRFSTIACGEIGRIPNDWARCLLPLVRDKKVNIEGHCKSAPNVLGIMDTIVLTISVYINSSMFRKRHQISLKAASESVDESVVHPLPTLFRLLELTPFRKAEFTPSDLFTRKRPLSSEDSSILPSSSLHLNKCQSSSTSNGDSENEESISDNDLDRIVGVTEDTQLEEMDPPSTLQCGLRPYQKQALHWMVQLERGQCTDDASTTLHPCWAAFRLADKRGLVIYLNAFSGDATIEFPSTLQMAKGGILADSMGLGKTIMTISLLLTHSERGGSLGSQSPGGTNEAVDGKDESSMTPKTLSKFSSFRKLARKKSSLTGGGNLIICPMTLIGQWKAEIETHAQPGSLSVYVHYGQSRSKDAHALAQYDVILTTYGVVASEYSTENAEDSGGLYSIRWFRVVLDEAHTIKSSKSQISAATAALIADRRWCLTGTPIQNKLEDVFSLLRFLRVEPWRSWAWWNKLVQKPFEEGDERGLKLVQSILKPIMLRRTKSSTDREGRPILVLPPATTEVIYCELTEAEKDFYDALFKRSKVKFDQFVEQGRVLHNYASILELLLRLRQCCDHPYLVLSRGDTQEFSDLDKLAKRFLKGGRDVMEGQSKDAPSHAYIKEVVEELRKGEEGECPICLEAFEDSVLTPCAHRLCRECLLASWRSANSGLCPVCRKTVNRQELITAPTESRFQIDIEKSWVPSSKVSALLHELEILKCQCSKSIVFSQWTAFLDLLQIPLSRSNISFVRLDGTLTLQQREKVLQQFTKEDHIMVLLMSLKAGGVGINLTAASNAFIMDPWWNPAVEEQAVMRIHRIGQTKSVSIKRFIVKGTVENRMEAVQARKQRMISGALTDQEVRTARIDELKMLFT